MRSSRFSLPLLLVASAALAASPRLSFERVLPAPIDLGGAQEVAIVAASGDGETLETFVQELLDQVNRSGTLKARDARRAKTKAEAALRIGSLSCTSEVKQGERGTRDNEGNRVRTKIEWADAACTASVSVTSRAATAATYTVRREATSPRSEKAGGDDRALALRQAARYAASAAAERIAPRRLRESIVLDDRAPAFEAGMPMIETERLGEARAAWERALRAHPEAAGLHFNLAAVCEALGDRRAAERHYARAVDLAPGEERFARERRAFQTRGPR